MNTKLAGKSDTSHNHSGTYAPVAHASTGTGYGIGNASNYGHVKLSDTYNSNVGAAANAIGASQTALYNVWANMTYKATLLSSRAVSVGTSYTLSDTIANYVLIAIGVYSGNEWKRFIIPNYGETVDCSWASTDNTSWYIHCLLEFNGDTNLKVMRWAASGFTLSNCKLEVQGIIKR